MICGFSTSIGIALVGMAGFEPAASTSQMWRDTGLRYIPKGFAKVNFKTTVANYFPKELYLYVIIKIPIVNSPI